MANDKKDNDEEKKEKESEAPEAPDAPEAPEAPEPGAPGTPTTTSKGGPGGSRAFLEDIKHKKDLKENLKKVTIEKKREEQKSGLLGVAAKAFSPRGKTPEEKPIIIDDKAKKFELEVNALNLQALEKLLQEKHREQKRLNNAEWGDEDEDTPEDGRSEELEREIEIIYKQITKRRKETEAKSKLASPARLNVPDAKEAHAKAVVTGSAPSLAPTPSAMPTKGKKGAVDDGANQLLKATLAGRRQAVREHDDEEQDVQSKSRVVGKLDKERLGEGSAKISALFVQRAADAKAGVTRSATSITPPAGASEAPTPAAAAAQAGQTPAVEPMAPAPVKSAVSKESEDLIVPAAGPDAPLEIPDAPALPDEPPAPSEPFIPPIRVRGEQKPGEGRRPSRAESPTPAHPGTVSIVSPPAPIPAAEEPPMRRAASSVSPTPVEVKHKETAPATPTPATQHTKVTPPPVPTRPAAGSVARAFEEAAKKLGIAPKQETPELSASGHGPHEPMVLKRPEKIKSVAEGEKWLESRKLTLIEMMGKLSEYIQNLGENPSKGGLFSSNQVEKKRIAEHILTKLESYVERSSATGKLKLEEILQDPQKLKQEFSEIHTMLEQGIKDNKAAHGSFLLHGWSDLERILKDIQNNVHNVLNKPEPSAPSPKPRGS